MLASRRVLRGEFFDLHYRVAAPDGAGRLGLIVPKRLARAASLRNAVKRQAREAFRQMGFEVAPGDLVLRLKRALTGVKARDRALRRAWRREFESLLQGIPGASR